MKRSLALAVIALCLLLSRQAYAACANTLSIKDGSNASQLLCVGNDGGSNLMLRQQIVDGTAGANALAVSASGTIAVTQSGTWNVGTVTTLPALVAGSALIGKVGIDQTTPGTTNAVQATNFPTGLTATGNALDVNLKTGTGSSLALASNQTNVQGVIGAATAPASMTVGGGVFNTALPTLTNGQSSAAQFDSSGRSLVTLSAVAASLHLSSNVDQLAGTTTDTNSGTKSAGTLRVVLATDQPALTNKLLVTPDSVALPANQSVNVAQLAGTTTDTNSGNKSAGTLRVVLATDQVSLTTPLNARLTDGTTNTVVTAASTNATQANPGLVVSPSPNPSTVCTSVKKINQTASTDLLTTTAKMHVCAIVLIIAGAEQISLVEGTGSVCATGIAALLGDTTAGASNGMPLSTNGGLTMVSDRPWMVSQTTADHICLLKSGANLLSGAIWYVDHA